MRIRIPRAAGILAIFYSAVGFAGDSKTQIEALTRGLKPWETVPSQAEFDSHGGAYVIKNVGRSESGTLILDWTFARGKIVKAVLSGVTADGKALFPSTSPTFSKVTAASGIAPEIRFYSSADGREYYGVFEGAWAGAFKAFVPATERPKRP